MKTHTIHWKSKVSGRTGAGTRLLEKEEAERLAHELNREYPGIVHQAVLALPVNSPTETVLA